MLAEVDSTIIVVDDGGGGEVIVAVVVRWGHMLGFHTGVHWVVASL